MDFAKHLIALAGGVLLALPAQAAITLGAVDGAPTYNYPATFDFDAPTPQWNGTIFTDSVGGQRAQPFGSTGGYASVGPDDGAGGTPRTLDLGGFGSIASVSFLWGSIDGYNSLDILGAGNSILATFSGSAAALVANGNQTAPQQNRIVTLSFTGADRDAVSGLRFNSSGNAFEFDNVRVSAVPEPAAWGMMMLGFGLVGAAMRSRRRQLVSA